MTDPEREAQGIFDMIRTSSGDRPFGGRDFTALMRSINQWKENNPALITLTNAAPAVHLAFQAQSTLLDATNIALHSSPKPLPSEIVEDLLATLRRQPTVRYHFPFDEFLAALSPD